MAMKLESGQHRALPRYQPPALRERLWQDPKVDKFAQDLLKYQQRKRCNPREDFLFSSLGGMAMGGLSGAVIGAVPGLPLAGVGALVTGAVGAIAGSILGSLVGVFGGGMFAACRVHCHTPDQANLSRHVFSRFHVVSMRHQSRRISQALVKHKVLYAADARRVIDLDGQHIDAALGDVRVFGRPLGQKKLLQIKNILHVQALNAETSDGTAAELSSMS
jgi:hypothetical protein